MSDRVDGVMILYVDTEFTMFMWHRHGGWLGVAFAHARSKERGGVGCVIVVREYGLGPMAVSSDATRPCLSVGVAARAPICCRTQQALVRGNSGPPRKCLRQSYAYNTQACRYQVGRSAPLASTAAFSLKMFYHGTTRRKVLCVGL